MTGFAPSTPTNTVTITVEFFASQTGDLAFPDQANVYLGSTTVTTGWAGTPTAGDAAFSQTFTASVTAGLSITATASGVQSNPAAGLGTSPMATNIAAATPFTVTTTADNGDNIEPHDRLAPPGDPRRQQDDQRRAIGFDLPAYGPGYDPMTQTWTITLDPTPLPAITTR